MFNVQEKWERRATVRSRPQIKLDVIQTGYFFPVSHQPLASHPLITALDKEKIEYLLLQSLYKYSNDIATIETKVVNQSILNVLSEQLPIHFDQTQKLNLYTIMVDEAYHAYVAYDAMLQVEQHTGIATLPLPKKIEIENALAWAHSQLDNQYHKLFDLIAVCLAENTITKEITTMTAKEDVHPFFQRLVTDHLADESRHCGIFFHLLSYIWQQIDDITKKQIASVLPGFLERYLSFNIEVIFGNTILSEIIAEQESREKILQDTFGNFKLNKHHPKLKNIMLQLDRSGVIDDISTPYFKEKNWL